MSKIITITINPSIDMSTAIDYMVPDNKLRCDKPLYEAAAVMREGTQLCTKKDTDSLFQIQMQHGEV